MLGLMTVSKLLKERSAGSDRPCRATIFPQHYRRLIADGIWQSAVRLLAPPLIASMQVLPIQTPTLASANGPSIMSAIAGGGTVSNAALKGDPVAEFAPEG